MILNIFNFLDEFINTSKHNFVALIHSHITNKIIFKNGHNAEFKSLTFFSKILKFIALLIPRKTLNFIFKNLSFEHYNVKVPKKFFNECVEYSFYDELFFVPKEYNNYLKYRYGDWKKKIKGL